MEGTDRLASRLPDNSKGVTPLLYALLAVPTVLSVAHHVDHLVRGNHLGWPLTGEVTAFTFSLAIYPIVAVGLGLTVTDRVGAGYWAALLGFAAVLVAGTHVGPWAVEPPADVVEPYADPLVGYLAFGVLLGLVAAIAVGAVYASVLWYRAAG
jgi:hypothetical protein